MSLILLMYHPDQGPTKAHALSSRVLLVRVLLFLSQPTL